MTADAAQVAALIRDLHLIGKLLEHAETHATRGNEGAVDEAIDDAFRRLSQIRSSRKESAAP